MATYYVDTASSGGDGTTQATSGATAAWATIASVNAASFSAGDSVLFKRGCTWREQLTVPSSGSAGNPITFGAYGTGADPIIDGTTVISPGSSWAVDSSTANVPNDSYSTSNNSPIANYIYFHGPITVSTGGTVTSMLYRTQAAVSTQTKVAIYTDSGGVPGALVTNSVSDELSQSANAWNTYAFGTNPTVAAGTYWMAILSTTNFSSAWSRSGSGTERYKARNYGDGFPASAGATSADQNDITNYGFYMVIESTSPTIWKSGATITTEPYVVYFDGELGEKQTAKSNIGNEYDWYWAADILYVYGDSDPDTLYTSPGIEISQRELIYMTGKEYVSFENLQLLRGGNGSAVSAVRVRNSGNIIFDGCTVNDSCAIGINMYASSGNLGNCTIQNCTFSDTGLSKISTDANSALQTYGTSGTTPNIIVEHCNFTNMDNYGAHHGHAMYHNTGNLTWRYNMHYGDGDVGGGGAGGAIHLAGGTNYIYCNLFTNIGGGGYRYWGLLGPAYSSMVNYIYNNVFYNCKYAMFSLVEGGQSETYVFKNNIFYTDDGSTFAQYILFGAPVTYSGTNNIFKNTGSPYFTWNNVAKITFADWAAASGESNYLTSDPLMVNPAEGNFALQSGSPCIDAGVDVGLTEDFYGFAIDGLPDIGAFETTFTVTDSRPVPGIGISISMEIGERGPIFLTEENTYNIINQHMLPVVKGWY